jgi:DNA-binding NtrC family response regulator
VQGLASAFVASSRASVELAGEDERLEGIVARSAGPLLDAVAFGRRELAELHTRSLFAELGRLGLDDAMILDVVGCLVTGARDVFPDSSYAGSLAELQEFLEDVLGSWSATQGCAVLQSTERPRCLPLEQPPVLVGDSDAMRRLRAELEDVARAPGSVLIAGESGTGKELVADALHRLAGHKSAVMAINCSALPRELIESELFGHERGAFTGSRESAPGLLRAAGDGTVFLDEVTEMPDFLQPKLLRVLEQRRVRPVGGVKEHALTARIVAATNRDPEQAVRSGRLRADLFYRLCVHRIDVPPLRERPSDIPLLIEHFLRAISARGHVAPRRFGANSLELLLDHDWPGNVRELRNVVEHCCATAKQREVDAQHLPAYLRQRLPTAQSGTLRVSAACPLPEQSGGDVPWPSPAADTSSKLEPLHLVERRHIERCLEAAGGNKTVAARLLGISRHQLYSKLQRQRP